ncbi:hypothetical protein [Mucilaginibacter sp. SP1R1]|uniref:hypothetical protein n=1 Tax=Mucilaginibacter sp. SP1R1 TaxID=2723091 RepID=UPI00160BF350|nr:hypothetical protein [Mucilaginibacter sp. SP1R1]MBB6149595.1 hypothetical protein [Mucilaginibacter sp. SP1R1]
MIAASYDSVEKEIVNSIDEVKNVFRLKAAFDADSCPGTMLTSQVLVTVIARIAKKLGVILPNGCYIFYDKKTKRQLSIKEGTEKFIKEAQNGK